ncbi:MAG: hypothetical protein ACRENS_01145 [Candidatus Eiseniibacteriota bacterium]
MNLNGRMVFALLLACFWIYMAWSAFSNGSAVRALVYVAIGAALTTWRLRRAMA